MIPKDFKLPFYAKASLCCVGLYAFVSVLYIAQAIIVPLIFSVIFAVVLHPLVGFMVRRGINRVVAISLALTLAILMIAGVGVFLFSQLSTLADSWPKLVERFSEIVNQNITWASGYFDVSPRKINAWITQTKGELINTNSAAIGQTLLSVGNALVMLILIPVYIFMILLYQPLLLEFFRKLFGADNRGEVSEVISQIKTVNQQYLTGLIIEAVLVSALNAAGLLILGIDYAVLLGIIGGLLNVIPYLGGIVGVALPMMIALVTKTSAWYAVYVMGVYYFIQLIDNNYIVPKIVASKVKINALVSIVVVLVGGALWGLSGMFLSIPITAIIKVICDHVEPLKPWGFLLGDTMPPIDIFRIKLNRK